MAVDNATDSAKNTHVYISVSARCATTCNNETLDRVQQHGAGKSIEIYQQPPQVNELVNIKCIYEYLQTYILSTYAFNGMLRA